jgi:hypothetical protein
MFDGFLVRFKIHVYTCINVYHRAHNKRGKIHMKIHAEIYVFSVYTCRIKKLITIG